MVIFRKSKKFGPFRLTFTKSGVSVSGGGPGARVSVNSRGEVHRTLGVPGTGVYDRKRITGSHGHGQASSSGRASVDGTPVRQVKVDAVQAAGSRDLLDGNPDIAYLKVVEVSDVPGLAAFAGVVDKGTGWVRGIRDGLLMPHGAEYRVFLLVQVTDNPALFPRKHDGTPAAVDVGRLGKHDVTTWAERFAGRSIAVAVYIDATPGMDNRLEVRFYPAKLAEDDTTTAGDRTAPKPSDTPPPTAAPPRETAPAGWYKDPWGVSALRWFDGSQWTGYVHGEGS